jgi:ATP-dependent exoDNAse (exonuclease V) beta subunit
MLLSKKNSHHRDTQILFKEENHEYIVTGLESKPVSVTTLIHRYFPEFDADIIITKMMSSNKWSQSKYFGRTRESIKEEWEKTGSEAAKSGTLMHKSIEQYLNGETVDNPDTKEFSMFMNFWQDITRIYPTLHPYRTEWLVYDENIKIAGSIDCVLEDGNGNLVLIDWKRSKEIKMDNHYEKGKFPFNQYDNCNYSHYTLQLNFYRHILETKYNKNVIFMMLVILHPNQSSYICHSIPRIDLSGVWSTLNT